MQPSTLERIGILVGLAGLVGFVVAATFVSLLLGLVVAAAFLVGAGVLLILLAIRREQFAPAKPSAPPTAEDRP